MFSSNTSQVSNAANYIEDVFSTYLYTGNGSTQTINNGIDLAGKGGLVWIKSRTNGITFPFLTDTVRGATNSLTTAATNANATIAAGLTTFSSSGFSVGSSAAFNESSANLVSWTFRKAPKFFDVVTYTGDGTSSKTVSHSLGSAPAFIVIKRTDNVSDWFCYHTSLGVSNYIILDSTAAAVSATNVWQTPTTTTFGYNAAGFNVSGATYVAYLYASNAGGFGLTGTDNVISCGSCSGSQDVNFGFEPQYVLFKNATSAGQWLIMDSMRGFNVTNEQLLLAESSGAEAAWGGAYVAPTATGFKTSLGGTDTFIYIAIRRGPMKVPTDGTKVFNAQKTTSTLLPQTVTTGFVTDLGIRQDTTGGAGSSVWADRLRGATQLLRSTGTGVEFNAGSTTAPFYNDIMTGWSDAWSGSGLSLIYWGLRRAPGFFDEVCYTGTGSATTVAHNLGVAPELMIVKSRSAPSRNWAVYAKPLASNTSALYLNSTVAAQGGMGLWNSTNPTSSVFSLGNGTGTNAYVNASGEQYASYLFASAPGVSKVGSYTGTGTTLQVNCGFTGGARFVLIKATSTTGDWLVWDSSRGIVAGNDPYLALNSTAAEVTTTDWVDAAASGFELSNAAGNLANSNGVSYIYLAIS